MSKLNGQELEIFRAGDYGAKGKYTPADLQQLASDYDPAKHEAPICVGHPKHNAPAFGWVKKLRAAGDTLFGTMGEVDPAFDSAVQAGRFKKRSIALLRDAAGKLQLRHVGWLGAMPPEVLGLKDATFSDDKFEEIDFSEAPQGEEMSEELKKTIAASIKEFFANLGGGSPAPQTIDTAALEQRLEQKFSAELEAEKKKSEALVAEFAAHKASTKDADTKARIASAISTLKEEHRWIPAFDRVGVPEIFAALAASSVQEIEFSAGGKDDAKKKADPVDAFASFIRGLGKMVPGQTYFTAEAQTQAGNAAEAPKVEGAVVDQGSVQFDSAIKARMAEKKIDYGTALAQLTQEGKSSQTFGSASGGEV